MITVLHLRNNKTGEEYRKTLEHGFDLQEAMDWPYRQTMNGLDPSAYHDRRVKLDMYACGWMVPRYPVPCVVK